MHEGDATLSSRNGDGVAEHGEAKGQSASEESRSPVGVCRSAFAERESAVGLMRVFVAKDPHKTQQRGCL